MSDAVLDAATATGSPFEVVPCDPELADTAYRQMQQLEFLDVFRYASPPAIELAARLAEITG